MVRIRTIKPEFWSDEKLSTLSAIDRLVFLGLIGMSDDYGRLHDNIKVIDAFVFPNSSETVRESLANLSRTGRIRRGKASNGKPVIEIANWSKHQRVDKPQNHLALPPIEIEDQETKEKPSDSFLPESFQNDSRIVPESFASLPGIRDQGSGTKDQGSSFCSELAEQASKPKPEVAKVPIELTDMKFILCGGGDWFLPKSKLLEYQATYPDIDLPRELRKAAQWLLDNSTKRKTQNGMYKFLGYWLSKSQNNGTASQLASSQTSQSRSRFSLKDIPV